MDLKTWNIRQEIAKYDESVQVCNVRYGYKVYHNGIEVYYVSNVNDEARKEANREANHLIDKLKQLDKTVYIHLHTPNDCIKT